MEFMLSFSMGLSRWRICIHNTSIRATEGNQCDRYTWTYAEDSTACIWQITEIVRHHEKSDWQPTRQDRKIVKQKQQYGH
jgi:hypothetical protein